MNEFYYLTMAGGTFALYSLICRHAKVSLLPNQLPSDARISSFRLKVPSPELERSLKIKEQLETSLTLKKLLLMLVLAGTAMVIADGVVTPAMSGFYLLYLLYSFRHFEKIDICDNSNKKFRSLIVILFLASGSLFLTLGFYPPSSL